MREGLAVHEAWGRGAAVLAVVLVTWRLWSALPAWWRERNPIPLLIGAGFAMMAAVPTFVVADDAERIFTVAQYGAGFMVLCMWLDLAAYWRRPPVVPRMVAMRVRGSAP